MLHSWGIIRQPRPHTVLPVAAVARFLDNVVRTLRVRKPAHGVCRLQYGCCQEILSRPPLLVTKAAGGYTEYVEVCVCRHESDDVGTAMAAHTIRKVSHGGIGYSVVDLADVRHVFVAAVPRWRWYACGNRPTTCCAPSRRGGRGGRRQRVDRSPVGVSWPTSARSTSAARSFATSTAATCRPPTTFPNVPATGKLLSIEALGIGRRHGRRWKSSGRANNSSSPGTTASPGCIVPTLFRSRQAAGVYDAPPALSNRCARLLGGVNVRFDQVIRTWLYLGGIVDDEGAVQRYQELNRARTDFYRDIPFLGRPSARRAAAARSTRPARASAPTAAA